MANTLVPLVVALLGGASMVVAAVLTRRSAGEDRSATRQDAEVRYLSERLDKERLRTDALEEDVVACHRERDADRTEFRRRLTGLEERIEHQNVVIRRLLPPGDPHV